MSAGMYCTWWLPAYFREAFACIMAADLLLKTSRDFLMQIVHFSHLGVQLCLCQGLQPNIILLQQQSM